MPLLEGKVAIVTGAGGPGCGRAISRRLAREGATVIACDVNETGLAATISAITEEGGRAFPRLADIGANSAAQDLIAFAEEAGGGLDLIVNNASYPYHPDQPFDFWLETLQVDLLGPMFLTLHGREAMRQRGGGAIVNITSVSALGYGRKHAHVPAFDIAKAGLLRLTSTLGRLATENIRVNALAPGWISSPEVQSYVDSLTPEQRITRGVPNRLITTEEIAAAVLRLATDQGLAGRVMVWWNDDAPRLIAEADPGYAQLGEPIEL